MDGIGVTMDIVNGGVAIITISDPPVDALAHQIVLDGLNEKFVEAPRREDVKAIVWEERATKGILLSAPATALPASRSRL